MVIVYCLLHPGARVVCVREIQKTLAESAKALIKAKIQEFGGPRVVVEALHIHDPMVGTEIALD
jgi:hypothetical protein